MGQAALLRAQAGPHEVGAPPGRGTRARKREPKPDKVPYAAVFRDARWATRRSASPGRNHGRDGNRQAKKVELGWQGPPMKRLQQTRRKWSVGQLPGPHEQRGRTVGPGEGAARLGKAR